MNEREFYAALDDWRHRPFSWGENCAIFVSHVIRRAHGIEVEVPPVEDARAAAQWLRDRGAQSLYHYLTTLFGRPVRPLLGRRGDIAYRKAGLEGGALGIIDRDAWFLGECGLVSVPRAAVSWVFKVNG